MTIKDNKEQVAASGKALLPFFLFLLIFMGTGLYFTWIGKINAFYQLPAPVAILPAIVLGILMSKKSLTCTIETFMSGAGQSNIMAMCLIFLLAGAFSSVTESIGAVQATVSLGLSIIPIYFLVPGLFLIACLVSMAMGTSVGTIAALGPIALGIAKEAGIPFPLVAGSVMSGAMFGDNLSVISDTTIAATRTQGVAMREKFKENFRIALPAALIVVVIYFFLNHPNKFFTGEHYSFVLTIPYLLILVLSLLGWNVFFVLFFGIALAGVIGLIINDSYSILHFSKDIMVGFAQNQEIFILSLLIGGLSFLVEQQGGLQYIKKIILNAIEKNACDRKSNSAKKRTEIAIAALVSITNILTGNNTVSIVVVGQLAKDLAEREKVSLSRSASLLDIFSCVVQGLIPYGFQALLLSSIFFISPIDVVSYSFYPMLLGVSALISMVLTNRDKIKII